MRSSRAVALALLLALTGAACSSGSDGPKADPAVSEQSLKEFELTLVGADSVSPHRAKAPLEPDVADQAMALVQQAFEATVVRPLRTGKAGDLRGPFTDDALERITGADAAVMLDTGLGRGRKVRLERGEVALTALTDGEDAPTMIVARIDWDVSRAGGAVRVQRRGELTLAPGPFGWRIGAYDIVATRTSGGTTTTTTAASE